MLTLEDIGFLTDRIEFRDWRFRSGPLGDGYFLQVEFSAPCTETNEVSTQRGRKWYLSAHSIEDEVVKTAWLAILTALHHEAMEEFRVDGVAPFHPHTDFAALLAIQGCESARVYRDPMVTN